MFNTLLRDDLPYNGRHFILTENTYKPIFP